MVRETVEIDGEEYQVNTDEMSVTKVGIDLYVNRFVRDHPAIVESDKVTVSDRYENCYDFTVDFDELATPGRGNIGSGRSMAYKDHIRDNGLDLQIHCIEPQHGTLHVYAVIEEE